MALQVAEFSRWALGWAEEHGGLWSVQENMVRLAEEVGEIARHVNAQGGRKLLGQDAESAAGEIGDALFVLALISHQLGTSLESGAQEVRRKQEGRDQRREDGIGHEG